MGCRHATEHEVSPERTLCGRRTAEVTVDNTSPECGACRRVIRSRCSKHNVTRCRVCPRAWNIGA